MKKPFKLSFCIIAVLAISLLSRCSKKDTDDDKDNPNNGVALYPVTKSYYASSQNVPPVVVTYTYDKDNHLINFQDQNKGDITNIGSNQVDRIITSYNSGEVYYRNTYSYFYTLENGEANIYNNFAGQVKEQLSTYEQASGVTKSRILAVWHFSINDAGLPTKGITSDGGGKNWNFVYDDKNNLKSLEFVELTGPRTPPGRLVVTSVDDKHAPFSHVREYLAASYQQSYITDFAFAYFQNNPLQIIEEDYDVTKSKYVTYEQVDFSYVYNEQGYPTQVTVDDQYFTASNFRTKTTYTFTYKEK